VVQLDRALIGKNFGWFFNFYVSDPIVNFFNSNPGALVKWSEIA
jgi:hypothetical protein